jgi:WXG100 family type VII secretion target
MMNDGFGTTVEEMERASRQVATVDEQVQSDLSALRSRLLPLSGAWQGEAAGAFHRLMERWDADAKALGEALRTIGRSIDSSGAGYRAHEEQHAAGMSSIRAALG